MELIKLTQFVLAPLIGCLAGLFGGYFLGRLHGAKPARRK